MMLALPTPPPPPPPPPCRLPHAPAEGWCPEHTSPTIPAPSGVTLLPRPVSVRLCEALGTSEGE
ncbi:hypothetical protein E2C01_084772 [Portunus trituberculatus]|uniref:Uncharacterized protein n=1 Tax=Portunus trituberculatus TaxID=210409 RepID=A0A5B7J0V9_PORTR|nr:hypothetical protein [Portunus trituberculatus]